jgi:hypothetical protein
MPEWWRDFQTWRLIRRNHRWIRRARKALQARDYHRASACIRKVNHAEMEHAIARLQARGREQ